MTFDDLRVFCTKHNIDNDEYGIYFHAFYLYPDGDIWLNRRNFLTGDMDVTVKIAEERTPRQMLKFIESLC